ncbi:MAG: DUF4011 domain-containing protein, partial [Anaerolineales bacterium]|nr:DUF4011 domain-containing protein [Anaerolineales bacterium]
MSTPLEARLAATLDHWKRSLLDLTKRNRAIHFRLTRVSTVTITGELPAIVYRQLVIEQARLRFKPAPKPEPPAGPTLRPPAPSLPLPSADPTDPLVD